MGYFPIFVDLEKFKILVIGGGEVATRKVENLLYFNGKPTIIAPKVTNKLSELILQNNLQFFQRNYQRNDISNYDLIFVATDDPELSPKIANELEGKPVLINFADEPRYCNFIMPSFIRRGDLVIAISSQGVAPFFSKYVRQLLEKTFTVNFADFALLAKTLREKIMEMNIASEKKMKIIEEFLSIDWLKILDENDTDFAFVLLDNLINHYARNE